MDDRPPQEAVPPQHAPAVPPPPPPPPPLESSQRGWKRWAWWLLGVLATVVIAGGIVLLTTAKPPGETQGATRGAADPRGFVLERHSSGRFAIALPPGWESVPPEIGFEFMARDTEAQPGSSGAVPTVGVVSEEARGITLDAYLEAVRRFFPPGTKVLAERRVEVPAGPAYQFEVSFTDDEGTVRELFYILLHDDRGYGVLFEADPDHFEEQRPTFEKMMSSFRFLQ